MTAPDVDALEAARAAATPGVWKLRGMTVHADQDGTSNVDTAVLVAHTVYRDKHGKPRTWDADLICKMHAALPDLLAAVRERDALRAAVASAVTQLEGWRDNSRRFEAAQGAGPLADQAHVRALAYERAIETLNRALLAAVDGGDR